MRLISPLAIFLATASASVQAQQAPAPLREAIAPTVDSLIARFLADDGPSAASVAVVRGRDTLVFGGWGLADRVGHVAATAETSYRIGSITKQFTAAAVLKLVDGGHLLLDDAIGQHLPDLPARWHRLTIAQLLNHTSGVPEVTRAGRRWTENSADSVPPEELIAAVSRDRLDFTPGTKYSYSNTGYIILGMLLEKMHSRPYAQVLRDELARPLGLSYTRYCEDEPGGNGQALGYERTGEQFERATYRNIARPFSAGAVCSTVGDLVKWNRALHGGKVVNPASYRLMTTPQGAAASRGYGFGLFVQHSSFDRVILIHGGSIFGFRSVAVWIPSDSIGVTVLTNTLPLETLEAFTGLLVRLALDVPRQPGSQVDSLRLGRQRDQCA
jgi:D-alanyl-D-alanine carboxypeptidase